MTPTRHTSMTSARVLGAAIASLTLLTSFSALASPPQKKPQVPAAAARTEGCLDTILAAEKELKIPAGLLLSVALTESGRGGTPFPYAMNVQGRPFYPKTEREAAAHLRDDAGRLRNNVYAGCMQLSVAYHKGAFRPVEKIVNPVENVRYAGRYLVRLRQETGSWAAAIARYSGGTGERRLGYQCRVHDHLVALGAPAAELIDSRRCPATKTAEVAPMTRRAFQTAAGLPVS